MIDIKAIEKFLYDRELRVKYQENLIKQYENKTLVTVRINYPGVEKSNYVTDDIVNIIYEEINTYYKKYIVYDEKYENKEGMIGHFLLSIDFITVKRAMIEIEESHILGRCVDIDVYTYKDGEVIGISRSDLYKKPRKCFICHLEAKICSRAQSHTLEEIKKYFEDMYKLYKKKEHEAEQLSYGISQLAIKAMISEVSTHPSFGLVSPVSNGSHKDMDYYTFLDSAVAIAPFIKKMAKIGYTYHKPVLIFEAIRKLGIQCEKGMFEATNNINTHKGMIFLMGICASAVAKASYEEKSFDDIKNTIKEMVVNILDDFKDIHLKNNLTHGEKLYLDYGFTGIRGEVKNGLEVVFDKILKEYENTTVKRNSFYTQILIHLMSEVEDSTIVYRKDIDTLRWVQNSAKKLLLIGGVNTIEGQIKIKELENEYIKNNISPGGCADLLAVSIFLMEIKDKYYN